MSTVENLNQLSALLTISPSFSLPELLTNLALSAIAGFLIKYLFIYCSKTFSNKEAISENFILMTMTTTIVIFIVKSSLALSLGLVGALSIVRFRTAIKEPEELSYIFLCIATGVGLGAGQPIAILTSLGVISIILLLRKQVPNKRQSHSEMVLTLRFVTPQQLPKVIEQLEPFCLSLKPTRIEHESHTSFFSFLVHFKNHEALQDAKDAMTTLDEQTKVLVLSATSAA